MSKLLLISIAVAFAIVASAIGLAWTPDRSTQSLEARWASAPSEFANVDGISVHMRDEGPRSDPHPIVLIHGTASSLHTWDEWVDSLKRRHRVVRLDLPGAGLTAQFRDDDYRIDRFVRFMGAFLAQRGIEHGVLVGNSLGGRIAWETAVARPDLVERLVLIDARGYPSEAGSSTAIERLAEVPLVGPFLIEHVTPRGLIAKSVMSVVGDPSKVTADQVDRYYELLLREGNRRALILQIQQESYADSDRIKSIAIPTLIIWGALDQRVPVADAERFNIDIADSQLVVYPSLGHTPQEEDPAQTVEAFEAFLERRPLS